MRAKPVDGRHPGWSVRDLAEKPYAKFWRPSLAPLTQRAAAAVTRGPVADHLLPGIERAAGSLLADGPVLEDGYALMADGSVHVAILTDMPGVTPAMVDWWFGWHSDSPERYKLWHPIAHVHARWKEAPPHGTAGRARYVGRTSIVDEYIGSELGRYAIRFVAPESLGFAANAFADERTATAICARAGMADLPVDAGWLIHHVRATATGSEMRSRFFIGGRYVALRGGGGAGRALSPVLRRLVGAGEADARNLLVHCAEEMAHLAGLLPALHAACRDLP